jgi:hypothetical protein
MLVLDSSKVRQAVQGQLPWNEVGFSENDPNDWYGVFLIERDKVDNTLMDQYSRLEDDGEEVDWSLFMSELEDEVFIRLIDALVQFGYTIKEN